MGWKDVPGLAWAILGVWVAYVIGLSLFYGQLEALAVGDSLTALFAYMISEPHIVVIFLGVWAYGASVKKPWKGLVAGFLISVALDQASAPFCVTTLVALQGGVNALCSDSIVVRWLMPFVGFDLAKALYYLVLPIVEVFIALELLTEAGFVRFVRTELLRR